MRFPLSIFLSGQNVIEAFLFPTMFCIEPLNLNAVRCPLLPEKLSGIVPFRRIGQHDDNRFSWS